PPYFLMARQVIANLLASQVYPDPPYPWTDSYSGWPEFPSWPTWHDRLHQQVRVEMLRRAWQGGLRVIVALACNSHALAQLAGTREPSDDKAAGDAQIAAIKEMASGQDFMEIALSPSDVRRIVGSGRLAVVIGLELDCIGNFYQPGKDTGASFNPSPSD